MLGIWFNNNDAFPFWGEKNNYLECLKRFGFTDAFVLIKGCKYDSRSIPEKYTSLNSLIDNLHRRGIRVHGEFYCSEDRQYIEQYPDRADTTIFGKKQKSRISHLDNHYLSYLSHSITSATREFQLDGIQFDFLRYGYIADGWSPDEERIYASFGVDVKGLKDEILSIFDSSKTEYNLGALFERHRNHDGQLCNFEAARRSIIRNFLRSLSDNIRTECPDAELSAAMMPEGIYLPWRYQAALHYGQVFEDFAPYVDRLYPMIYTGAFNMSSDWVGKVAKNVLDCFSESVIGIDCIEPKTSADIRADIKAIQCKKKPDLCFFRYGRMVLAVCDGQDTLLYNTYPGTVTRLILNDGKNELEKECEVKSGSCICIPGQWGFIRAFGSFTIGKDRRYDGELCVLKREDMQ